MCHLLRYPRCAETAALRAQSLLCLCPEVDETQISMLSGKNNFIPWDHLSEEMRNRIIQSKIHTKQYAKK